MKRIGKLAIGLCCFCLHQPALAKPNGITYDCDTASDHFSELVLPMPAGSGLVTGNVTVRELAKIKEFAPLFRIAIAQAANEPGVAPKQIAGFKLTALPAKSVDKTIKDEKAAIQFIEWDDITAGKIADTKLFGMNIAGTKVSFSLRYDAKSVVVKLGGDEKRFDTAISEPVLRLICSTGEFLVTELVIGTGD